MAGPGERFWNLLAAGEPLVADGPMGTRLAELGLAPGEPPEAWLLEPARHAAIRAVHRSYLEAGARILLTDTFGGHPVRLARHGLADGAAAIDRRAVDLARAEAGDRAVVAGSMGPTGEFLEPLGTLSAATARAGYAEQAAALANGGVDVLWIETMSDMAEVRAAVEGAREVAPDLPIVVTLTFNAGGATMMGTRPAEAADALAELGVAAAGANCGTGSAEVEAAVAAMHAARPDLVLVGKPNAGLPRLEGGRTVYEELPETMGAGAARILAAGARIVGACCGGTPDHVRAIADAAEAARVGR
ncbi:MAG TPA: homocysteine S-methyltransferase family protein [Candidatus Limnocylindrales bacterium]